MLAAEFLDKSLILEGIFKKSFIHTIIPVCPNFISDIIIKAFDLLLFVIFVRFPGCIRIAEGEWADMGWILEYLALNFQFDFILQSFAIFGFGPCFKKCRQCIVHDQLVSKTLLRGSQMLVVFLTSKRCCFLIAPDYLVILNHHIMSFLTTNIDSILNQVYGALMYLMTAAPCSVLQLVIVPSRIVNLSDLFEGGFGVSL